MSGRRVPPGHRGPGDSLRVCEYGPCVVSALLTGVSPISAYANPISVYVGRVLFTYALRKFIQAGVTHQGFTPEVPGLSGRQVHPFEPPRTSFTFQSMIAAFDAIEAGTALSTPRIRSCPRAVAMETARTNSID